MPRKQPHRFAAFVNGPKVAAAFLILVTLGCAVGTVIAVHAATALRDHGQRVMGEVVEVHHERRDSHVVVTFPDAQGVQVRADVGNYRWDPTPRVGDRPQLVYDPENPSGNVADVRMGPDFFSAWALGMGGVLAAALVLPTWTGRLDWNALR